jgi:hypothetical protein
VILRPFFTYYGGKWRVAKRYPAPQHERVVEPFAGAAGYSVRHYAHRILLVDADPVIVGVWDYLIRTPAAEIMRLPLWPGPDATIDDLHVCREARDLIGFCLNKGTTRPSKSPSAWMRSGAHDNEFWGEAYRARIARQVEYIRHWRIIHASYDAVPEVEATYFIDPPYQGAGKHYVYSSRALDYERLGEWCRSRPGQVIVCEGPGATWLPFRPHLQAKANESATGGKVSHEYIWTNDASSNSATGLRSTKHNPC